MLNDYYTLVFPSIVSGASKYIGTFSRVSFFCIFGRDDYLVVPY